MPAATLTHESAVNCAKRRPMSPDIDRVAREQREPAHQWRDDQGEGRDKEPNWGRVRRLRARVEAHELCARLTCAFTSLRSACAHVEQHERVCALREAGWRQTCTSEQANVHE